MSTISDKLKRLQSAGPILGLLLFVVALWILHHELRDYHYHDIRQHIHELSIHRIALAMALTVLSYFVLTLYDTIALLYIRHRLSYGRTALASFLGYVFSHNIGLSFVGASAARFRIYTVWGLSALEVASIVVFGGLTFCIGFGTIAGAVFTFAPLTLPATLHLPFATVRPVGILLLSLVAPSLVGAAVLRRPIHIRGWPFTWPSLPIALGQLVISCVDWLVAACVLYVLLPSAPDLSPVTVLGVFALAEMVGLISHVPGGIGVFEMMALLMLSPYLSKPAIIGTLIVYRLTYYVLPLIVGLVALAIFELLQRRKTFSGVLQLLLRWLPIIVPNAYAMATFVAGMVLLFSGALPAAHHRLLHLIQLVPLSVIEVSHILGSMVGAALLLLARGLQRRLDGAYWLCMLLLAAGILFSLLKGFDYEEAIFLAVVLLALAPTHRYFYRTSSLLSERFTLGWIVTIVIAVVASVWIGFFSYKHVEYAGELWWHFSLAGQAPRFLRASFGAIAIILLFAIVKLLRPGAPRGDDRSPVRDEAVRQVIEHCPYTYANLAWLGDKTFLLNDQQNGFIMYGVAGPSWIAMGDPVAPDDARMDLIWRFRERCDRHGGWSIFYEVSGAYLPLYLNAGLTALKIGEEARVPLTDFDLEGHQHKDLRQSYHRAEREGCTFELMTPEAAGALLTPMRQLSNDWLREKKTREKGFSLGAFREEYLRHFPFAIVRQNGRLVAFANIWLGADKEEVAPDLMRHATDAPRDAMAYLLVSLLLWGKHEQYRWLNLGMAPLSGLENRPQASVWTRFGSELYEHGEYFYNFQGLRSYKEKFNPVWEPKYLAAPTGAIIPRVFISLATLTSGGLKGALTK